MNKYRIVPLLLSVSAIASGQSVDQVSLEAECRKLSSQGDLQGAILKAQAAVRALPGIAYPHGVLSEMLLLGMRSAKPGFASKFRQGARTEASAALRTDPAQSNALETLRTLDGRVTGLAKTLPAPVMDRVNLADAQFYGGHPEAAGQQFEEIVQSSKGDAALDCYAGDAWLAAGKNDAAALAYQRALQDSSECSQARRGLATLAMRTKALDQAQNLIIQVIQSNPLDSHAWDIYEQIEKEMGRPLVNVSMPAWGIPIYPQPGHGDVQWFGEVPDERPDHIFWDKYHASVLVGWEQYHAKDRWDYARAPHGEFEVIRHAWLDGLRPMPHSGYPAQAEIIGWIQKADFQGQLTPALFALLFDSRWEGEYRVWLKGHPTDMKQFLLTFPVRRAFL